MLFSISLYQTLLEHSNIPFLFSLFHSPWVDVIVLIVPFGDFPTCRPPDSIVRTDIVQNLVQIVDPVGHADHKRVKRQTKYSAACDTVPIECIEMITNHPVVLFRRVVLTNEDADIVHSKFVGNYDHAAAFDAHRHRLFVRAPVADVLEALGSKMIRSVKSL